MKYEAIVIGTSAGGLKALVSVLADLPEDFPIPILVVQHLPTTRDSFLVDYLNENIALKVQEAESHECIVNSVVYVAPPNYHMLIEKTGCIVLSVEEKVNFSRPSIDLLFITAAEKFKQNLIGIILTGANSDGSKGLKRIKELGGTTIVQDPDEAEVSAMPNFAIQAVQIDYILKNKMITKVIEKLIYGGEKNGYELPEDFNSR